ncbi:MAG: hypothetical protein NVS2B16_14740 [Chloroflexota bacterium]
MRRPLIATTLVVAGTFGTGYLVGQIKGAAPSFAATTAAAKKHTSSTTKKLVTGRATQKQAATSTTGKHADGQVTAVRGNTITVKADADKAGSNEYTAVTTILLNGSTQYEAGRGAAASSTKPTISVGQSIVAEGSVSTDGTTLTATLVSVHTGGQGHGGPGHASRPHADGTVSAVSGNVITVKADADRTGSNEYTAVTTINLTASTQYNAGRDSAATTTRPAIAAGDEIEAEGTLSNDGTTLTATRVSVRPAGTTGH